MATKIIDDSCLTAIANAIRSKGVSGSWTPSQMASAIGQISSGDTVPYAAVRISDGEVLFVSFTRQSVVDWINNHGYTQVWVTYRTFAVTN